MQINATSVFPSQQSLHKLRFLQKLGCQKPCWDQARLSSVVNKQVAYNVPFQEIPNVFSILKRILGKLGFPGLPLRCVAETSLQVSAVLRSKLYIYIFQRYTIQSSSDKTTCWRVNTIHRCSLALAKLIAS